MKTIVDGLLRQPNQSGVANGIECDRCHTRLAWPRSEALKTLAELRAEGWVIRGDFESDTFCPDCAPVVDGAGRR
jgi:hypothetical protein